MPLRWSAFSMTSPSGRDIGSLVLLVALDLGSLLRSLLCGYRASYRLCHCAGLLSPRLPPQKGLPWGSCKVVQHVECQLVLRQTRGSMREKGRTMKMVV